MANIFSTVQRAFAALREEFMSTNVLKDEDFDDYTARILRYAVYFAFYENTAYRDVHSWATTYRTQYSLYKYIRNIYNPAYRLVEFWKMVIWGGGLDPKAGEEGAIPIITDNDSLRTALATLWESSDWSRKKSFVPLWACSMGDAAIKIIDDPEKEEVYFDLIHPSKLRFVEHNRSGIVTAYSLQWEVVWEHRTATYIEEVERVPGTEDVEFRTYKDGELFAWNGISAVWRVPYGFVPFVHFMHNDVGRDYGWAEIHTARSKIHEVDEQASKLNDYNRKAIDPIWLFNFKKPKNSADLQAEGATRTSSNPQPGREEVPALYVPDARAKAQPLVTDQVNVEDAGRNIQDLIAELEREFPELQMDIWSAGEYTTGKALINARKRVERKVVERRPNYDIPLMRAHHMAIAIGGERGYEGYDGFDLGSFERGDLDHVIKPDRDVFDVDNLEAITERETFWRIVIDAYGSGLPVEEVLIDLGWSKSRVDDFMALLPEKEVNDNNQTDEESVNMEEQDVSNEENVPVV